MNPVQIIKINHKKLRPHLVVFRTFQQLITGDIRKIIELEILDEDWKALFDVLIKDMPDHKLGLTRSRRSSHQKSPEKD